MVLVQSVQCGYRLFLRSEKMTCIFLTYFKERKKDKTLEPCFPSDEDINF